MLLFESGHLLRDYSTIKIGGPAKYLVTVKSIAEMQEVLKRCHEQCLPYLILGKGSNSLFDDQGFEGVAIINKICSFEEKDENQIYVGAGYSFSLLGSQTARRGLGGLEFASGIPGSVGGAVFMNAGASGSETSKPLRSVDYVDERGSLYTFRKEELAFGYRTSTFQEWKGAIVGATFQLYKDADARTKQMEILNYRTRTQPYSDPSAGCIFQNPTCGHAGALIEKYGLKGSSIGGAQVSAQHANFIINKGGATAKDVHQLIMSIQTKIEQQEGITLKPEIRQIPYKLL